MSTDDRATSASPTARPLRRRAAVDGRVRTGCLTCKARKKKCEGPTSESNPRCKSCVRLGLVCEQLSPRRVVAAAVCQGRQTLGAVASPKALSEPSLVITSAPQLGPSGDTRDLLRYFLDRISPLCSILEAYGSRVCSALLPMAFVDPYLMQALFTYACYHSDSTPIIPGSTIRSQQDRRLRFKNDVVKGIGQAIAGNAVTETTLACALLMSTVESISGDTSSWLVHLQGAGHLVNHLGMSSLMQSTDGDFLLRYFAYHDIMAALSTGCRTLLDRDYWVRRAEAGAARLDKAPDPFMGLADDLFLHLFDVCAFVAATGELTHSSRTALRTAAVTRAAELAKAIVGQDLHHPTEAASEYQQALIHHAEAFRYAALVYLYRHLLRFCDKGVYGRHIVRYAGRIIHHVSLVPGTIEAEMGIVFPLFMAGVAGGDEDTVAYVESRLTTIETWTRFRHVGRARGFLQLLWSQGRTDSEVLLQELGWSLSLA